ncbi:unnamed protein product [Arctia plantaginis]|uniref:Uncharacterized protein n=1 Tax=Arctia plantaginis TaxID=874455 RepID=A0A8S0Z4S0_ARCPL|nr:unnamed protein product [Arctia plantaginis]
MAVQVILRVLLLHLAAVTAQFMPNMPQMAQMAQMAQMPQGSFPFFGSQGQPIHIQMPQGGMPLMPNMPHMPGMHMSGMQSPLNGGRLPMVVMPHYTKKNEKRRKQKKTRRRNRKHSKGSSSSEESCSSEEMKFRNNNDLRSPKNKRQEILTPVVSYVTKDGYVIYQKKIKKEKAKDWLELSKDHSDEYFEKTSRNRKHHNH